ncbi:MAG: mechanosensitive ion channel family protein, partial [Mucispirillum sp.]|nr:mechanosensitive ion channel family protein [Mucispirillum sp.]
MEPIGNLINFLKSHSYWGNSFYNYSIAFLIFIGIVISVTVVIRIFVSRLSHLENIISNSFLSVLLESFRLRLIYIAYAMAVYGALTYLTTTETVTKAIDNLVMIYISVIVVLAATDILKAYNRTENQKEDKRPIPAGIVTILKFIVWASGLLFIFSNLGYNVNAFITGLGIGGIAIALAAQNILGDLFNYFVILFDKPFARGDLIQYNNISGRVEYVGIKSTKIRSSNGELLSVSNTDLTKSVIHNYDKAQKRRNVTVIGVEYETPAEIVRKIPSLLEEAVKNVPNVELARVHFSNFGSSSLDFEVAYYVLTNNYTEFTQGIQEVNFAILEIFTRE